MKTLATRLSRLGAVLLPLIFSAGLQAQTAVDPMTWTPRPPAFRERMPAAQYEATQEAVIRKLEDFQKMAAYPTPVGLKISGFAEGSPAQGAGLNVGDMLVSIEGHTLWSLYAIPRMSFEPLNTVFVTKDGDRRSAQIPPGSIGIEGTLLWLPHIAYLQGKNRSPQWDRPMVVAAAMMTTNPDLAETALFHALHSGYKPDAFSCYCGAEVALAQGRMTEAADFAWYAVETANAKDKALWINPVTLYRAAIANYKLDGAIKIVRKEPGAFRIAPIALEYLTEMHTARAATERARGLPSELAKKMYHDPLNERMQLRGNGSGASKLAGAFSSGKPFSMLPQIGEPLVALFRPRDSVRDLQVDFHFKATPVPAPGLHDVEISLVDLDAKNQAEHFAAYAEGMLTVALRVDTSEVILQHSNIRAATLIYQDRTLKLDGKEENTLTFVRIGGQGEIILNGRRIAYVPVSDKVDNVGIAFRCSAARLDVVSAQATELIETP